MISDTFQSESSSEVHKIQFPSDITSEKLHCVCYA